MARDIPPTAYIECHIKCSVETAMRNNKARENRMGVSDQTIRNVSEKMEATQYGDDYSVDVETEKLFKLDRNVDETYIYSIIDAIVTKAKPPTQLQVIEKQPASESDL